ncbi:hypothetical protein RT723_16445 [Psychrosphaera aquimarina]|uniref:Glycosyl transferase family 1 domain-containing protein n=1 Tax=Psychrosphaera aquimarina TaxID=2044854 RepID=A0ABU3R4E0_9GAMM|nr:hypothetical protein [Psychrosphaera aquimarina]MDU0114550.1 hypothetical protein [Psychrosphaera aquimarina]
MSKKVVAVLAEMAFVKGIAASNPTVAWLDKYFSNDKVTYIMRGNEPNTESVINLPPSQGTIDYLKNYFFNRNYRIDAKTKAQKIRTDIINADLVWVRAPSLVPMLIAQIWKKEVQNKLNVHICANRMTWRYLKEVPTFKNLARLIYGVILKLCFKRLESKGVKFYFTGNQVKDNFGLKNGTYLIDYLTGPLKESDFNFEMIALGRTTKFVNNKEMLRFAQAVGSPIDIFGPGEILSKKFSESYNTKGIVSPSEIQAILSNYNTLICISFEYYEGFPRVIAEAIQQNLWVVVTKKCVFYNDIKDYPKLIISESIYNKQDYLNIIESGINSKKLEQFKALIRARSLLK